MSAFDVWLVLILSILAIVLGLGGFILFLCAYAFRFPVLRKDETTAEFQKRLERLFREMMLGYAFFLPAMAVTIQLLLWDRWPQIVQYFQSLGGW